jgi:hypothetical protein
VPRVPVRLFYTGGDREATPTNTLHCVADLARQGFAVRTRDPQTRDHTSSGRDGVVEAIRWFRRLDRLDRLDRLER